MKREDTQKKGRRYRGVIKTIVNQYRKHVVKKYSLFMFLRPVLVTLTFVRYEFETGRYIEERKKMPRRDKEKIVNQ